MTAHFLSNGTTNHTSLTPARRAVVIGGGLAGLASACELAARGFAVTVVERNAHLGGKMNVLQDRGYTFDCGPTILTLPQVFTGIVARCAPRGRTLADYARIVPCTPQWRCFYEDGTRLDLLGDVPAMAASLDRQFHGMGAGEGWTRFLVFSRRMLRLSERVFFYKDVGSVLDLVRAAPLGNAGIMRDALAMRPYATVGSTIEEMIREPHARQLAEHFLQYVGSSPFLAPAILGLIAAAQSDHGCCYALAPQGRTTADGCLGGTRVIAQALASILRERGAMIITGVGVRRVLIERDVATGVELDNGRTLRADVVVSNCDVQRTLRDLVPTPAAAARGRAIAKAYTPACSGVVLYLGLDRQYEQLAHHNFSFSRDAHDEFSDIYTRGIPARDPTLYIAAPSRSDPSQAPPGCEALYVLIHTPHLRPDASGAMPRWDGPGGLLEQYRPVVMDKCRRMGLAEIEKHIVVEHTLTPEGIERRFNAEGGAIYGLASHGRLKGGFKPRNRSLVLKNLYLAGGSVNPGPGVPMVLMSGVTAALAACEDAGMGGALDPARIETQLAAPAILAAP
ncbi:MAG: phytoene desaturase family protein [Phycisphaerales bacterium]